MTADLEFLASIPLISAHQERREETTWTEQLLSSHFLIFPANLQEVLAGVKLENRNPWDSIKP